MKINFEKIFDFVKKEANVISNFFKAHIQDALAIGNLIKQFTPNSTFSGMFSLVQIFTQLTHRKVTDADLPRFAYAVNMALNDLGYMQNDELANLKAFIKSLDSGNPFDKSQKISKFVSRVLAHLDNNENPPTHYDAVTTLAYLNPEAFMPEVENEVLNEEQLGTIQE